MKHSPLPWTAETYSKGDCIHEMMIAADGKCIFDTANSDRMLIEAEHDPDGPGVDAWDAQGRADFEFILKAISFYSEVVVKLNKEPKASNLEAILALARQCDPQDAIIALANRSAIAEQERDEAVEKVTYDERERCAAIIDSLASKARGEVLKFRMDDREFREWSARAAGLEDAAEALRSEIRSQRPVSQTGS